MTTDTLDMSILATGWEVAANDGDITARGTHAGRYLRLAADGTRPITLNFKATNVTPPAEGKILVMQALRHGGELWAIRMLPSGRLMLNPGTRASRESVYGYPGELRLGVSYNPATGALSVAVADSDGPSETFDLRIPHAWGSEEDYEILLGAPKSYADQTPLGWRIDCSFMLALEQIIDAEDFYEVEKWAKELFNLVDPVDADEVREEAKADALFEAETERNGRSPIDPLAVINSALAYGQIGRVPWALVERGDGLVLAIGDTNIPIDTPQERLAAEMFGYRLHQRLKAGR